MDNSKKNQEQITYLGLFRKSLAVSFSVFLFGIHQSYATNITTGSYNNLYNTTITQDGNTWTITNGRKNGDVYFHNFNDFNLSQGDIVNYMVQGGNSKYINLVNNQVRIDGIFNSLVEGSGGTIGGNIVFVSPKGMIVGSTGVLNVGSFQLRTPLAGEADRYGSYPSNTYNYAVSHAGALSEAKINSLAVSNESNSEISGKIFARDSIDIYDSGKIKLGNSINIVSGFNDTGFAKTKLGDFADIVNTDGIVESDYMSGSSGNIKLVSKDISSSSRGGLIQSTGNVEINTPTGATSTVITNLAKVEAGGDVVIGNINKDKPTESTGNVTLNNSINAGGSVTVNGDNITINKYGVIDSQQNVSINASTDAELKANINSVSGTSLYAKANLIQGENVSITNSESGNIKIDTVNYTQQLGSAVVNNGEGNIVIEAPGIDTVYNLDAQNGYIEIKTKNLTINDKVSASGDISISGQTISQSNPNSTAIESGGNVSLTATGAIGSSSRAISIDASGNVILTGTTESGAEVDAYIKGSGSNDLNLGNTTAIYSISADSENGININGDVTAKEDIKLTATTGINQSDATTLKSENGSVALSNTSSGDITTNTVTAKNGILINNEAEDGNVTLNNTIKSEGVYRYIDEEYEEHVTDYGVKVSAKGSVSTNNIQSAEKVVLEGDSVDIGGLVVSQNKQIDVTSKNDITQSVEGTALQAQRDVNLTSESGNVGTSAKRLTVKSISGTVKATAAKAVGVEGVDTDISLSNMHAGTDYNLATTGTGNLNIGGAFTNENGSITLKSDKQLNIENDIKAKDNISLNSTSGISQNEGTIIESGFNNAEGGNVEITNSGADGIKLKNIKANNGNITVTNTDSSSGAVETGMLSANEGTVSVTNNATDGNIVITDKISADTEISLTAKNSILQNAETEIALDSNGDIVLRAINGSVGDDTAVTLNSEGKVTANALENINIVSPEADLTTGLIQSSNGSVSVKTTNDISHEDKNITLTDRITGDIIEVNAAGNILQDTQEETFKTLDANSKLIMTAQKNIGSISDDAVKSVAFSSGGELSATAMNGSVAINGIETSIDTKNVSATNNLYIKTSTVGDITVSNEQNVTGKIQLDSAGDINLNKKISATGDVNLSAKKDVKQGEELTGTALASGHDITITAANAGTADKYLIVDAQHALNIGTADSYAGNVYVEDNTDNLSIGKIYSGTNVNVKAHGDIVQSNPDDVSINSIGSITLHSETGDIGGENALKLNIKADSAKFNVTKANNVNVTSVNNDLNIGDITAANDVTVSGEKTESGASSNINLKGLIKGKNITINSVDSIVQSKDVTGKTIDASGDLTLISQEGSIGGNNNNNTSVKFGIGSGSLSAQASSGSVYLTGVETDISTGSIQARDDIALTTETSGDITVLDNLNAKGNITLHAADSVIMNNNPNLTAQTGSIDIKTNGGDVVLNSVLTAGTDINIDANGSIKQHQDNNSVVLNAGGNISLTAEGSIGESTKSLSVELDGRFSAKAGKTGENGEIIKTGGVYVTSNNKDLRAGLISANDDVDINVTGTKANGQKADIILKDHIAGKNVTVTADGSITQDVLAVADRSIEATGNVNLTAKEGNIGETGKAIDFSAGGDISADARNGSVVLNAIDTDISTQSVKAKTNIDLTTKGTGKITVHDSISTTDGYISLNSAKNLEINHDLSAGKYITLVANGGITQSDDSTITAGTNSETALNAGNINITNSKGGDVVIKNATTSKGSINITNNQAVTEESSKIITGLISANNGSVQVTNNVENGAVDLKSQINAGSDITITASGNIENNISGIGLVAGNDITLSSSNGDIAESGKSLKLQSNGSLTADGNNIYIESPNKQLKINGINKAKTSANGTVDVKTTGSGDVVINDLVKGGNVSISSAGSVSQKSDLQKAVDASGDLNLTAQNGNIGDTNSLNVSSVGDVSVSSSGLVNLKGVNSDIKIKSMTSAGNIDIVTTTANGSDKGNIVINSEISTNNGHINLDAAKGVYIEQGVHSNDAVTIKANGGDSVINSAVDSTESSVKITAANEAQIGANVTSATYTDVSAKSINQTTGQITASGNNSGIGVNLSSTNGDIELRNVVSNDGKIKVSANGSDKDVILYGILNSNLNDIEISSQGNISQNAGGSIVTQGNVVLSAQGDIGKDTMSMNINADGTVNAKGNDIYLRSHNKDLNISGITGAQTGEKAGTVDLLTTADDDNFNGNVNISGLIDGTDVVINADKTIRQTLPPTSKSIDAKTLNLNAEKGHIGLNADNPLNVTVEENITANSGGHISLKSADAVNTGDITAVGKVNIVSNDAITLNGLMTANIVNLEAEKDITQDVNLTKSIETGALSLTSNNGNIGTPKDGETPANAIDFSASGSLSAKAQNGSIVLNGVNTSINTSSIVAGENIDLSTTGAGSNLTVSDTLNATNGYIHLSSAEDLSITKNLTANDFVSLEAQKSIDIGSAVTSTTSYVTVDSGTTTTLGANVTANTYVDVNANGNITQTAGAITASGNNDGTGVNITSTNGGITVKNITSNDGKIKISANGTDKDVIISGILNSNLKNIEINSKGDIIQTTDGSLQTSVLEDEAGNVVLTADGDIGTASQYVYSEASGSTTATGSNVYLGSKTKNLNIGGITATAEENATVNIKTDVGNVNIDGLITGNDVTIDSAKGIAQSAPLPKAVGVTNKLTLTARDGDIGQAEIDEENPAVAIKFSAGSVEAQAQKGSVILNGQDTTINTGNISARDNIDLTTTNTGNIVVASSLHTTDGYINLNSAEGLTLNETVTSDNSFVKLGAQNGDVTINKTVTAKTDVSINSSHDTKINASVSADNDVKITSANKTISDSAITSKHDVNINSGETSIGGTINATHDALITSKTGTSVSNTITAGNNAVITTTDGNTTLGALVSATNDITVNSKNIKQTVDTATLKAKNIKFNATENIGESSETGKSIVVDASKSVDVQNAYDAYIESTEDLKVGSITVENSANLTAQKSVLQDSDGDGISSGNTISLKSITENIGSSSENGGIKINSGVVNADAQAENGSTYLRSTDDITIGTVTSADKTNINSDKGIKLTGLIKSNSANLNAKNDISQNADGKYIETTGGNITLVSTNGNIGTPKDGEKPPVAIGFATQGDGSISATATNGSVVLKGIDTDISTSTIQAKNDIDLATTGTGSLTVANDLSAGGYIRLDSASALTLTKSLDAQKDVTLISNNGNIELKSTVKSGSDITVNSSSNIIQDYNGTALDAVNNINLTAGADIGSSSDYITVKTGTTEGVQGIVNVEGVNAYIKTLDSNLSVGIIDSTGIASLISSNDLTTNGIATANTLTLTANGDIRTKESLNITNGLTVNSHEGSVKIDKSVESSFLDVDAKNNVTFGGNVTTTGLMDVDTTSGSITANGTVTAGSLEADALTAISLTKDVTVSGATELTTTNGDVTADGLLKSNSLTVTSGNKATFNALDVDGATEITSTDATKITGNTESGSLKITSGKDVDVNRVDVTESTVIKAENGAVTTGALKSKTLDINAKNNVLFDGNVTTTGLMDVDTTSGSITANGTVTAGSLEADALTAISLTKDVTVSGATELTTTNGDVTADGLLKSNSLTVTSGSKATFNALDVEGSTEITSTDATKITGNTESGSLKITSGKDVDVNRVDVTESTVIKAENGAVTTGVLKTKTLDVDAKNNVTFGGNVTTTGLMDVDTTSGSITANGTVTAGSLEADALTAISLTKDVTVSGATELTTTNGDVTADGLLKSNSLTVTSGSKATFNALDVEGATEITSTDATKITGNTESGSLKITATDVNVNSLAVDNKTELKATSGSVTVNGNSESGEFIASGTNAVVINNNLTSTDKVTISANNGVTLADGSTITAQKDLTISTSEGEINLGGDISSKAGNVSVKDHSTANGSITTKGLSATGNIDVENFGNGLINIQGDIENNGVSSNSNIIAHNNGANSGINISGGISNKGSLSVISNGEIGTTINGDVNNEKTLNITNNLNKLTISSDSISNGKNSVFNINNNGSNGVSINSDITNNGEFVVTNTSGELTLDGKYTAKQNSQNTFNNSGSDLKIVSGADIVNEGSTMSFNNTGNGSLILGKNAQIAVYSILDQNNVYTGTLNLNNSGVGGDIQIDGQIFGLADTPIGYINMTNDALSANSSINFGQGSYINAISDAVKILNNAAGGINFGSNTEIKTNSDLNIYNSEGSGISFGANNNISGKNVNIQNKGNNGISMTDTAVINADSNMDVSNTGIGGIKIEGTIKGKDVTITTENSDISVAHNKTEGNVIATNSLTVKAENGDIVNTSLDSDSSNMGFVSKGNMKLTSTNGNIGRLDNTLNNIIQNGFVINSNNSIIVAVDGTLDAYADNDLNIRSIKDLNIDSLSSKDALISTLNGSINAGTVVSENLYMQASGNGSNINITNLANTGKLTTESVNNTTIHSTRALDVDSMLSKNGSIKIDSDGNTSINEISASNDITINVEDKNLSVINLGRVERDTSVTPKTVNITVKDSKQPPVGSSYEPGMSFEDIQKVEPNSVLDIYNGYVQDKVTLKADTINAQVYDISEGAVQGQKRLDPNGNEATGFHNANKNGKLLEMDIQGANYAQPNVGSNPYNGYYVYDSNDKHALSVHLTLGDSVGDAPLGADIKKLYSDYAFIDTVVSDSSKYSNIVLDSAIIGEAAIIRNNKHRLDINNTDIEQDYPINIHYPETTGTTIENKTSFNASLNDEIHISEVTPTPPGGGGDEPKTPEDIGEKDPNRPIVPPGPDPTPDPNPDPDPVPPPPPPGPEPEPDPVPPDPNPVPPGSEPEPANDKNVTTGEGKEKQVNNKKSKDKLKKQQDKVVSINDFDWKIETIDNKVIGSSEYSQKQDVTGLYAMSHNGVYATIKDSKSLKKDQILYVYLKKDDKNINVESKVRKIKGNTAEIVFPEMDKMTKNIMLYWYMQLNKK